MTSRSLQQFEHRLLVGHVAEVRREHWIERLRDQFFHIAETLDHARGLLIVDVDDDESGSIGS